MWFYGAIIKRGKTDDERKHDRPTPQLVNWDRRKSDARIRKLLLL